MLVWSVDRACSQSNFMGPILPLCRDKIAWPAAQTVGQQGYQWRRCGGLQIGINAADGMLQGRSNVPSTVRQAELKLLHLDRSAVSYSRYTSTLGAVGMHGVIRPHDHRKGQLGTLGCEGGGAVEEADEHPAPGLVVLNVRDGHAVPVPKQAGGRHPHLRRPGTPALHLRRPRPLCQGAGSRTWARTCS